MPTKSMDAAVQVVRGRDGRVVVILWGEDAAAAADDWSQRGYRVDAIDRDSLVG